jgi:WhiB family redox-sensing transcriptional regulator
MTAMWKPAFEPDSDRWRDRAACRHASANLIFPAGSTDSAVDQIPAATATCRACPVHDAGVRDAIETNYVWGGKDEDERRTLRKTRAGRPRAPRWAAR